MTGPTADPDGAEPVDRRWFEEALRSQGFVVEPPADDAEADTTAAETAEAAAEPEVPPATASVERPPMPSALLARIAARGQPGAVIAPEPEPVAVVTPATDAPEPGPVLEPVVEPIAEAPPAIDATAPAVRPTLDEQRPAPWASAVVAPIAPWAAPSDTPPITQPEPEPVALDVPDARPDPAPEPEPVAGEAPTALETIGPVSVALADEAVAEGSDPPVDREPIDADQVTDAAEAPIELPVTPAAVLDSPYTPVGATAAAAVAAPRPAPVTAGPEASEGELWALVGASEPSAAKAPASEAARVILTILTAFLILVIVVGALVLASQIA